MNASMHINQNKSLGIAVSYKKQAVAIAKELSEKLGEGSFAFLLLYFSPQYAKLPFAKHLISYFPDTPIYGCSTAGEMALDGTTDGAVVAIGFSAEDFSMESVFFSDLQQFSIRDGQEKVQAATTQFQNSRSPSKPNCFALMMIDGLSYKEEQFVSALNYGLKDIPLIGGSAGDGLDFKETFLIHDGEISQNSAILLIIESRCPLHIFKCDSFIPTETKFVVTKADPENRIVYELNALPASTAYAQALGLHEDELDLLCFASHPLCVCFGGQCYVRSIKDLLDDGALSFYCAIDEGIVFTLSEIGDMVSGIENTFDEIRKDIGQPQLILGFDCVLRRMMSEINQSKGQINKLFKENKVVGFNTYGEQVYAMHQNLTFSGIAIGR